MAITTACISLNTNLLYCCYDIVHHAAFKAILFRSHHIALLKKKKNPKNKPTKNPQQQQKTQNQPTKKKPNQNTTPSPAKNQPAVG